MVAVAEQQLMDADGQARERRGRLKADRALPTPHGFGVRKTDVAQLRPNGGVPSTSSVSALNTGRS